MKEGWEYKKLGDVCDFEGGSQPPKSEWINHPQEGFVRMLQIRDFTQSRSFEIEYVKNTKKIRLCKADDILIGRYGASVGKILTGLAGAYNVAIIKSIPDEKVIAKSYIRRYFESSLFQSVLFKVCASRAAQAGFSKDDICDALIPVPPLSEQQSIVDYLDSAFAKIDAMKANAEKALNEAKVLFQASLKEMLEPKEGWDEKKLGDICSDIRYGTSTPSNENGEYKYLRMNNITNDGFLDVSHYKTISLPEKELEKCLVKKGDIIFNRTNSRELVGKSCVFTEDENMVIAGYLIRIRLKEGFEPQFITYNMNLQRSMGLFQHLIVGAVHQANISANNIQKVLISYPPLSEQQSIVSALDSLKSKVDKLQENYDKISQECDALKQAILRQVFE